MKRLELKEHVVTLADYAYVRAERRGGMASASRLLSGATMLIALAACGGGGGSATGGGGGGGGLPPTPTPSPNPTLGVASSGRVIDLDSGAPIAGATVVVGTTLILGSTPPPSLPAGDVSAATKADGSYLISPAPTGTPYVHVFTTDHVTLHARIAAPSPGGTFADVKITKPTADELAELNDPSVGLNTVRAQVGIKAVSFDEYAVEAARAWSARLSLTGLYTLADPSQPSGSANASIFDEYFTRNGLVGSASSGSVAFANLGGGSPNSPGTSGMQGWLAEKSSNGPHYQNLVSPAANWVGFGNTNCAGPAGSACAPGAEVFVQLFVSAPSGV